MKVEPILRCDFYVYVHRRATDGRIFYVGKGTRRRAWATDGRSTHWNRVVSKYGFIVEVYKDSLSEADAFNEEKALIKSIGLGNLVNHTYGGEGVSGYRFTEAQKTRLSISKLGHKVKQETKDKISMSTKGKVHSEFARVSSRKRMMGNNLGSLRVITDELREKLRAANKGFNSHIADLNKYRFIHKDGRVFIGTRFELKDTYGDCVRALFYTKPNKSVYGWRLDNEPR